MNAAPVFINGKPQSPKTFNPLMAEYCWFHPGLDPKKRGFIVGIITDSYFVASEIIRKRVFADFSIAHLLEFKKGIFTGELEISPLFISDKCKKHDSCKLNVLGHIDRFYGMDHSLIHFAGDGLNDVCLLENLANTFAVKPTAPAVSVQPAKPKPGFSSSKLS